jgi:hypothetical protein
MVRDQRIEGMGSDEFMHVYAAHSWLVGTLRKPDGEQRFASMEALQAAAPEVITALKATFEDLESSQSQKGVVQGNS